MVKFDVDAVAPFASVTVTDTVKAPPAVGVPEIVPVEALRLKPLANVPVSAYVRGARPPAPGTAREKALNPVLLRPVTGVAMVRALATARVAAVEVVEATDVDKPLLMEFDTTTVKLPASEVATVLMV